MIELSAAGRAGTRDEVGNFAALLIGPDCGVITGSDFLTDGGVTAAYWYGELAPDQNSHWVRAQNLDAGRKWRSCPMITGGGRRRRRVGMLLCGYPGLPGEYLVM